LFDLSLLLERDLGQGFFRLHDIVRQFLRDGAGKERLVAQHKNWLRFSKAPPPRQTSRLDAMSIAASLITSRRRASAKNSTRCCSTRPG
jgi:hypothetical protein